MLELESRILVISAPRAVSCWLISSARPTKLRATSALTPSRVRSTSLAFCLSTLLTPVDTAVSVRSTSPALCLIVPLAPVEAAISERSSSAAPCLSVVVMPVLTVATERSVALRMLVTTRSASVLARLIDLRGLGRVDLDGFRKRRHAGIEGLGHGLGPRVDMLVDRVDAADPQVLEAADDLAERTLGLAGDVGDGALGRIGDLNAACARPRRWRR